MGPCQSTVAANSPALPSPPPPLPTSPPPCPSATSTNGRLKRTRPLRQAGGSRRGTLGTAVLAPRPSRLVSPFFSSPKAHLKSAPSPNVTDVTPSVTDVTPSVTDVTPSVTDVTPSVTDVTPSVTDVTPKTSNVTAFPSFTTSPLSPNNALRSPKGKHKPPVGVSAFFEDKENEPEPPEPVWQATPKTKARSDKGSLKAGGGGHMHPSSRVNNPNPWIR